MNSREIAEYINDLEQMNIALTADLILYDRDITALSDCNLAYSKKIKSLEESNMSLDSDHRIIELETEVALLKAKWITIQKANEKLSKKLYQRDAIIKELNGNVPKL